MDSEDQPWRARGKERSCTSRWAFTRRSQGNFSTTHLVWHDRHLVTDLRRPLEHWYPLCLHKPHYDQLPTLIDSLKNSPYIVVSPPSQPFLISVHATLSLTFRSQPRQPQSRCRLSPNLANRLSKRSTVLPRTFSRSRCVADRLLLSFYSIQPLPGSRWC